MCKCHKSRKSNCTDFEKAITSIAEGIEKCINTWRAEKGKCKISLLKWKARLIKEIDTVKLKHTSSYRKFITNSLGNHQIREASTDLNQNFTVVAIGKASGIMYIIYEQKIMS